MFHREDKYASILGRYVPQRLEGGMDISCTQVYGTTQCFHCTAATKGQRRCHCQAKLHSCPILQSDSWGIAEIEGTTYHSLHSYRVQECLSLSPESLHRVSGRWQPAQAGFSSSPSSTAGPGSQKAVLVYRALGHHTLSYLLTDSWPAKLLALYQNKKLKEIRHERAQTVCSVSMKSKTD